MKKIKLVHSLPDKKSKFKEYCELTFSSDKYDNIYVTSLSEINFEKEGIDIAFVHCLKKNDINFLNKNTLNIPKVWFSWGGDVFRLGKFYNLFLLEKTKILRNRLYLKDSIIGGIVRYVLSYFPSFIDLISSSRNKLKAIDQFDYLIPVMPGDYELIKKHYSIKPKFYHINYINPIFEQEAEINLDGSNILLGNSATFTNNHIEAIDQLCKYDLEDRQIIIPLSYGRTDVSEYISKYSEDKLGIGNVKVLINFIPFNEYSQIVSTCEIVIMNHLRQQAVGNIVQALLFGSHLYLQSNSTVFKYLKDNGIYVSAFDEADELQGLDKETISLNKKLTRELFGEKLQKEKLEKLITRILQY